MSDNERVIPASDFKSKCLSLLNQVEATGRSVVITRRGKPIAKLVPFASSPAHDLRGSVLLERDIISPIDEKWDAER